MDIDPGQIIDLYGLGQQFKELGSTDGDWIDHKLDRASFRQHL